MSLNLTLRISDFHNLKIVNNIFSSCFKVGLFLSRGVYICVCKYKSVRGYGLVWFDSISAVGYKTPNPVFTYILSIWFVNKFCRYSQLNDQTVLFLTIQFSLSQQS